MEFKSLYPLQTCEHILYMHIFPPKQTRKVILEVLCNTEVRRTTINYRKLTDWRCEANSGRSEKGEEGTHGAHKSVINVHLINALARGHWDLSSGWHKYSLINLYVFITSESSSNRKRVITKPLWRYLSVNFSAERHFIFYACVFLSFSLSLFF